ncbi:ATP-binding protein [Mycobacteroides abscessus]|uniref:AAA family ATPase n=1 Tax=Mycobacteroides abscessus TaxID=36809 RepID=UPI0034CDAC44
MTKDVYIDEALVHLARLAMSGREQDVVLFVQRIARRLRHTNPGVAEGLTDVLREAPTRMSPLRSASPAPMPVDTDSRLPLLRVERFERERSAPILTVEVREALAQIIDERGHSDRLLRAGLAPSRAALFVGPPGVGKTMAAGWIAESLGMPLAILDLSSVMSSLLGKTGINLRHAFDYAKQSECVLFLDELDAIAKRRGDDSDVGELKRLVTVLLQQIDDWPSSAGLVLGATNHPDLLDPAVWRRFDTNIVFEMPDIELRAQAIERFSEGTLTPATVAALAASTDSASFSDLERQVLQLRRNAVIHGTSASDVERTALASIHQLDLTARLRIAMALHKNGRSQRQINAVTGISRDTLRKHLARS